MTDIGAAGGTNDTLAMLKALERKVLWLAMWTIHNANHIRPSRDGIKVGGHQASCASVATIMTALYFDVLRPEDRIAVKPHASPVFHAIQYMMGRQKLAALQRFRAYRGAQSYPSRTKDSDEVDFSTGSVGLGVAMTLFASMVQDYVRLHDLVQDPSLREQPPGRIRPAARDLAQRALVDACRLRRQLQLSTRSRPRGRVGCVACRSPSPGPSPPTTS